MQNKISAVLSDQDRDDAIASIEAAQAKLPFLIAIPSNQKKKLRKLSSDSVEFVSLALDGSVTFKNALRADFPHAEFAKDVDLLGKLNKVRNITAAFLELLEDSITLAGSDAMTSADVVYSYLKKAAESDANAKDLVSKMGKKYEAQRGARKDDNK